MEQTHLIHSIFSQSLSLSFNLKIKIIYNFLLPRIQKDDEILQWYGDRLKAIIVSNSFIPIFPIFVSSIVI